MTVLSVVWVHVILDCPVDHGWDDGGDCQTMFCKNPLCSKNKPSMETACVMVSMIVEMFSNKKSVRIMYVLYNTAFLNTQENIQTIIVEILSIKNPITMFCHFRNHNTAWR